MKMHISNSILFVGFISIIGLNPWSAAFAQDENPRATTEDSLKEPTGSTSRKLDRAADNYRAIDYVDALEVYKKVADKGYSSPEINLRLGNLYYFRAQYKKAAKWYERLFERENKPQEALTYLRYSQCLKAKGEDRQARQFFEKFQKEKEGGQRSEATPDKRDLIRENSGRYGTVEALKPVYSEKQISYGQTVNNEKLIYSTTVDKPATFLNTKDGWNGLSFMALYEIEIDSANRATGEPQKIHGKLKKRFHDASPVITNDGQTLYFTRTNYNAGKNDNKNGKSLKIYRSFNNGGSWEKPEALPFNGDNFSTAHPALSPDEKQLYFASDREGTLGQSDLYVVDINEDGSFGDPENLGEAINTKGRENFPFVSQDSLLYFSSDGHFGLGGLDVFMIDLKEKDKGHVVNLGKPVNSYADDFAYGVDDKNTYGFLSSDRSSEKDTLIRTNIYRFKQNTPPEDVYAAEIEGYVTDKETGDSIEDAVVSLTDLENNEEYAQVKTDDKGYYHVDTERFSRYTVRAEIENFEPDEKVSEKDKAYQRIDLQLQNMVITPGTDLAKMLNIPRIYFDFDKYDIRNPDATRDLEKVYQVMQKHAGLRLKIRSHTDSRGSMTYNQELSENRAKSTRDWLIDRGVDADRLEWEGVGESELVNKCADGVPCSAEKHQENRRSEFIIISGKK